MVGEFTVNFEIIKCHGSGNDFLLIDEMDRGELFTEAERSRLTISLCNRESNLGADGILFVLNSKQADARMRVFNSDGSEASMCGNGLRCVARYVCEKLGKDEALIETMKVNLHVKKQEELFTNIPTYQVEISPVSFRLADLPFIYDEETLINEKIEELSSYLSFTAVAVPNPHLICIVGTSEIHSDVQKNISEYVNGPNELFPDGVNVSFVKVLEEGKIYVRTFERGVGFTNACGTAMSASTLVTCLNRVNEKEMPVEVYNNGGMVRCIVHETDGFYSIDLIGNATYVFDAKIDVDLDHPSEFTIIEQDIYELEGEHYAAMQAHAQQLLKEHL